ncbi:MAG: ABC transporter ATP-binding protein [Chloroflexi bacterium]|nr:ABC transporter ATP-binding protein [Chloroflexota bacterium]
MAEIELRNVTKTYVRGMKPAVRDFSLQIPDGHFIVLLGPSGCGKSTTLRMIAGLEEPDSGQIRIGGKPVNGVPPQRRDTAFVFQNYALYPHMTVAQNIGFPLKMRGRSARDIRQRAEEIGRILGLESLLDRYPAQLSGGERQRVAVGRALVRNPAVFLFDEPLSNLDAQLRVEMRVELVQLQHRLKATFVFVTHDQVEAMTLADLIAVMHEGVLQQTGTPEEIYQKPANLFVAGFIGSPRMNFIEGSLSRENGDLLLKGDKATLRLKECALDLAAAKTPDRVVLGFRPEDVQLSPDGNLALKLELVETLGSQKFVYGVTELGQALVVGVDPKSHLAAGDVVHLSIPAEYMHFFDAETGTRLAG